MKTYALLFALVTSLSTTPGMAQDNLEVDSMLSIVAKPKLAVQIERQRLTFSTLS